MRTSAMLFPLLSVVLFLELAAVVFTGRLAIGAHSLDIASDVVAFLIVMVGALFSGKLDDRGRLHKDQHREQRVIAFVNLGIIWVGVVLILRQAIFEFGKDSENLESSDWWVLLGPVLATVSYWWIRESLSKLSIYDVTARSLMSHVEGDIAVSVITFILTLSTFLLASPWVNSIGGIIMSAIILYVSLNLLKHILGNNSSITWREGSDNL